MDDKKLMEIEVKLAFQEHAVKDQNAVIYKLQRQVDALEKTVKNLKDRMKSGAEQGEQPDILDEKPPHY
jgi:SlyX protein